MTKASSIPKPATYYKHSKAKEEDEQDEQDEQEEEDDMASHPTEDVRPRCHIARSSTAMNLYADLFSKSEAGSSGLPDCGDSIDQLTFEQILEMDDDEDEREFSKSIVYGFFEQAEGTFEKMNKSL